MQDNYIKVLLTFTIIGAFIFVSNLGYFMKPYKIIKLDRLDAPLARFNEQTGETEYWGVARGGWVKIADSGFVTVPAKDVDENANSGDARSIKK